ncbi:hypothetical protein CRYUN_Cryun04dG0049300 [Craigia yunnanensis]
MGRNQVPAMDGILGKGANPGYGQNFGQRENPGYAENSGQGPNFGYGQSYGQGSNPGSGQNYGPGATAGSGQGTKPGYEHAYPGHGAGQGFSQAEQRNVQGEPSGSMGQGEMQQVLGQHFLIEVVCFCREDTKDFKWFFEMIGGMDMQRRNVKWNWKGKTLNIYKNTRTATMKKKKR